MRLIDIGVNLMNKAFAGDREAVWEAAAAAGVSPLVITGASEEDSLRAARYAALYPGKLYATAGVHPHNARLCGPETLAALRRIASMPCVAAIGECGLDYNRDFSPRPAQREWFEKQAVLAGELGMPLFLHERDAFDDFYAILSARRADLKAAVVHCFTGTERELSAYLDLDCYIGITGWICDERRGRHLISLLRQIPPDRLLLETDAPYLIPRDMEDSRRSARNEPRYLPHIASVAAGALGKDPEILAEETWANTRRFFDLPDLA
jgi:TatD DNase family protein